MTWDRVTDDPLPLPDIRDDPGAAPWYRRYAVALALLAAIALAIAVLATGSSERPEEQGEQFAGPGARVRGPGTRSWVALTAADGVERAGWPLPMIARGPLTCFGFGRVDFERPRPTLARCVERADIPELPPNGIVSLVVVQAGFDTWHLLQVGGDVGGVELLGERGEPLDGGRIHTDGELMALRLPTSTELSELSWIIGRARIVCAPTPEAVTSGEFCP